MRNVLVFVISLLLILSAKAFGGGVKEFTQDGIHFGKGSAEKSLIFNYDPTTDSARISVDPTDNKFKLFTDELFVGKGSHADAKITIDRGGDNPAIKWNELEQKFMQIGTDGTEKNLGGGSGVGSTSIFYSEQFEDGIYEEIGNNTSVLGGGTLGGTLEQDKVGFISGEASMKYSNSVTNDYFCSAVIEVPVRSQTVTKISLQFPYTYVGNNGEMRAILWDEVASAELQSDGLQAGTHTLGYEISVTGKTQLRVCFQSDATNSSAVLLVDDIVLDDGENNTKVVRDAQVGVVQTNVDLERSDREARIKDVAGVTTIKGDAGNNIIVDTTNKVISFFTNTLERVKVWANGVTEFLGLVKVSNGIYTTNASITTQTSIIDASSNSVAITLPDAATYTGVNLKVLASDLTNVAKILPSGTDTIQGESELILRTVDSPVELIPTATNWVIGVASGQATKVIDILGRYTFTGAHSVPDDTITIVPFDTTAHENNIERVGSRVYATHAGSYRVSSVVTLGGGNLSGKRVALYLYKNGVLANTLDLKPTVGTGGYTNVATQGSTGIYLSAGDYVEIRLHHNYGVTRNISLAEISVTATAYETGTLVQPKTSGRTGTIFTHAGDTAPSGAFACDGAKYLKADYPELYSIIGDTYQTDATALEFNVPTAVTSGLQKEYDLVGKISGDNNWALTSASIVAEKFKDNTTGLDKWRIRGNIIGTTDSTGQVNLTIDGVSFSYAQAILGNDTNGHSNGYAYASSGNIRLIQEAPSTQWRATLDLTLDSKPTWADDDGLACIWYSPTPVVSMLPDGQILTDETRVQDMIDQSATEVIEGEITKVGVSTFTVMGGLVKVTDATTYGEGLAVDNSGSQSDFIVQQAGRISVNYGLTSLNANSDIDIRLTRASRATIIVGTREASSPEKMSASISSVEVEAGDFVRLGSSSGSISSLYINVSFEAYNHGVLVKTGGAEEYDLKALGLLDYTDFGNPDYASGTPYKDANGKWRIRIDAANTSAVSQNTHHLKILGIDFAEKTAGIISDDNSAIGSECRTSSSGFILIYHETARPYVVMHIDAPLTGKPTWATDYTQDVHGFVKNAVIYEQEITADGYLSSSSGRIKFANLKSNTGGDLISFNNTGAYSTVVVEKACEIDFKVNIHRTSANDYIQVLINEGGGNLKYSLTQGEGIYLAGGVSKLKVKAGALVYVKCSSTIQNTVFTNMTVTAKAIETGFIASSKAEISKNATKIIVGQEQVTGEASQGNGIDLGTGMQNTYKYVHRVTSDLVGGGTFTLATLSSGLAVINGRKFGATSYFIHGAEYSNGTSIADYITYNTSSGLLVYQADSNANGMYTDTLVTVEYYKPSETP